MRLDRIIPEINRGKGWAKVFLNDNFSELVFDNIAIVRSRHEKSYLGKHGWQISESRIPLLLEESINSNFSFLLPPSVVQYMEVSSNYEFIFFEKNANKIVSVIVRWSGISYRAPRGEISPIEDISITNNPVNVTKPEYVGGEKVMVSGWPFTSSPKTETPPDLGWHVPPNAPSIPPPNMPDQKVEDAFISPTEAIQEPIAPYLPKEVKKIKCRNSKCGANILDSMQICPFCNFPSSEIKSMIF